MDFEAAAQFVKDHEDFDPLGVAEELTGKSYKDSEETTAIGFVLNMNFAKIKREALQAMDDTHMSSDYNEYVVKLIKLGFVEIYNQEFKNYQNAWWPETADTKPLEHFKIFWNPLGVLFTLESYNKHVNSAHAYFNWKSTDPTNPLKRPQHCSNGMILKDRNKANAWRDEDNFLAWECGEDMREGLIYKMVRYMTDGVFLPKWHTAPHLWFMNFGECHELDETCSSYSEKSSGYDRIGQMKYDTFPAHVKEAIGEFGSHEVRIF